MSKISDNVLNQIKTCHICPKPKWHFLLKNSVIWAAFVIAVVLGSLSFSVAIDLISRGDWDIYEYSGMSFLEFCLLLLPFLWITFLCIFAIIAFYNWKYTKHGYRFRTYAILILSIGLSSTAGILLYNFGFGKKVNAMMMKSVPLYHKSQDEARDLLWLQPSRGLLVGEIVEIKDAEKEVKIKDVNGKEWIVEAGDDTWKPACCKRTGKEVRIIGTRDGEKGEQRFVAKEIRQDDDGEGAEDFSSDFDDKSEFEKRKESKKE